MKKTIKIILWAMLAITIVLLGIVVFGAKDATPDRNPIHIDYLIYWTYFLVVLGIAVAVGSSVYGMIQNPKGLKGTLVSLLVVAVVLAFAIGMGVKGNDVPVPNPGGPAFDDPTSLTVTGASIIAAYIAMGAAFLAAIYSEVKGAIK